MQNAAIIKVVWPEFGLYPVLPFSQSNLVSINLSLMGHNMALSMKDEKYIVHFELEQIH